MPKKISPHASGAIIYLALLSPSISVIGQMTRQAGHAAWLAPVLMLVPLAALYFIGTALDCGNAGLGRKYEQVFGKIGGKLICVLYLAWILAEAAGAAHSFGIRLQSMVYRGNSYVPLVAVMMILVAVSLRGGIRALAGVSEIFLPVIVLTIAAVCILTMSDARPQNLGPYSGDEFIGTVRVQADLTAIPALAVLSMFMPMGAKKQAGGFSAVYIITISAAALTVINSFGPTLASQLDSAFFLAAKDISISGVIQRLEPLVLALWTVTDYVLIAFLILAGTKVVEILFEKQWNHTVSAALSAVVFVGAVIFDFADTFILKIAAVILAYLVPSAAIIIQQSCNFKGKYKHFKKNNNL